MLASNSRCSEGTTEQELTLAAKDLVDVRTDAAVAHERVKSSLTEHAAALHAPEGGGRRAQKGEDEGDELGGVHRHGFATDARKVVCKPLETGDAVSSGLIEACQEARRRAIMMVG